MARELIKGRGGNTFNLNGGKYPWPTAMVDSNSLRHLGIGGASRILPNPYDSYNTCLHYDSTFVEKLTFNTPSPSFEAARTANWRFVNTDMKSLMTSLGVSTGGSYSGHLSNPIYYKGTDNKTYVIVVGAATVLSRGGDLVVAKLDYDTGAVVGSLVVSSPTRYFITPRIGGSGRHTICICSNPSVIVDINTMTIKHTARYSLSTSTQTGTSRYVVQGLPISEDFGILEAKSNDGGNYTNEIFTQITLRILECGGIPPTFYLDFAQTFPSLIAQSLSVRTDGEPTLYEYNRAGAGIPGTYSMTSLSTEHILIPSQSSSNLGTNSSNGGTVNKIFFRQDFEDIFRLALKNEFGIE